MVVLSVAVIAVPSNRFICDSFFEPQPVERPRMAEYSAIQT